MTRFALEVLASVLSGPRTARLTKPLVFDQQAAASVVAQQSTNEDVGEFRLAITPRPGHSLTDLESAAGSIIATFQAEGPTAEEIQKATAGDELEFLAGLQSNLGKSFRLTDGAGFHGDAGYFRTEYQKLLAVTAADVKRVAGKYLTPGRIVLSVVPPGKADQAARPDESKKVPAVSTAAPEGYPMIRSRRRVPALCTVLVLLAAAASFPVSAQQTLDRTKVPAPGPQPVLRVPSWTRSPLGSGAELMVAEKTTCRSYRSPSPSSAEPTSSSRRTGEASETSPPRCSAKARPREAARSCRTPCNSSARASRRASALRPRPSGSSRRARKFGATLDILADMLLHSTFPADALERLRGQRLVALAQAKAQPGAIAARVFPRVLYGPAHPFGQPVTETSIKAITRDDVVSFHQRFSSRAARS